MYSKRSGKSDWHGAKMQFAHSCTHSCSPRPRLNNKSMDQPPNASLQKLSGASCARAMSSLHKLGIASCVGELAYVEREDVCLAQNDKQNEERNEVMTSNYSNDMTRVMACDVTLVKVATAPGAGPAFNFTTEMNTLNKKQLRVKGDKFCEENSEDSVPLDSR